MMKTVSIATLGCKVNQFESEALMLSLEEQGYQVVPFGEPADITIINTCTVTHRADFQCRQTIRRASRLNPKTRVVVTGCYAQVDAERLASIEGVACVVGNADKARLAELLPRMERSETPAVQVSDIGKEVHFRETPLLVFHRHTRAFLKIQDGCNAFCAYCIVPHARGRSRSLPVDPVMTRLNTLRSRGFKEVVLTGIHLGAYGLDLDPAASLERLLEHIEAGETSDRIRLTSVEPGDFSPGLIDRISRSRKICPHLHVPIQSGDDGILGRMNRPYNRGFLTGVLVELHDRIPLLCLGADVIAGFPGESDEAFRRTYGLIEELPLSYLHVFPFSPRKGTAAATLPGAVPDSVTRERTEALRDLGKRKRLAYYSRFLHRELDVLVENRREKRTGRWKGLSRNYLPVVIKDGPGDGTGWVNEEWRVWIDGVSEEGATGHIKGKTYG
jgi:threonylcarbamoyladenosine tRNA methylthiotransferase MtaB